MVDTRNYFTHYGPALAARAALPEKVLPQVSKLAALFQLHLLQLVGMDVVLIDSGLTAPPKQLIVALRRVAFHRVK